jgi:HSP20 family protein
MLMRTDPFRELDRLTQQVFGTDGTLARPSVMPMDAWRDGDTFHVEFDLPGVNPDSIDLDVERNVVTVQAERPARADNAELIAAERPRECSAVSWSWVTTSTPSASPPAMTPGCSL